MELEIKRIDACEDAANFSGSIVILHEAASEFRQELNALIIKYAI